MIVERRYRFEEDTPCIDRPESKLHEESSYGENPTIGKGRATEGGTAHGKTPL
jgi:hypothetical protein